MAEIRRLIYKVGRTLQVAGLAALPFSLWIGFVGHDEQGSLMIFLGSIAVFYAGYFLTRVTSKI